MSNGISFSRDGLSDEEWKNAGIVMSHLARLELLIQDFSDALGLIDHSMNLDLPHDYDTHRRAMNWANMGRFYAVFALSHFHTSLRAIRERVRNTKALIDRWDINSIAAIVDRFEELFPNLKTVRDSAAHQSDRAFKIEDIEKHGHDGAMLPLQFWKGLYGASHEGDFVGLHLTEDELQQLMDLQKQMLDAFSS